MSEQNTTEELLTRMTGSVVVVGNATVDGQHGTMIDSFDNVIRFNNYVTLGYEHIIGSKTTFRCTSGWLDIEPHDHCTEFSPFCRHANESNKVDEYNRLTSRVLIHPKTDVHELTSIPNPSTGLACLLLLDYLGIKASIIGFDSFRSPNMGKDTIITSHSRAEGDEIKSLANRGLKFIQSNNDLIGEFSPT